MTVAVGGTLLGQSGPMAGTTATTTTWQRAFTVDAPAAGTTMTLHVLGTWQLNWADLHSMAAQWTVVGTVGCGGSFRHIYNQNGGADATDSGDLNEIQGPNTAFFMNVSCSVVASFTVSVAFFPAS
ncbi:MAG: hypothetical protein ABSF27_09695 [Candidatus Dormibacteria bacterium]